MMMEFFKYLLEVSICIAALYIVYHFFLQQEKTFQLNRSYLLLALITAFAIPCINVVLPQSTPVYLDINPFESDLVLYYAGSETVNDQGIEWTWQHLLMSIYSLGVLMMFGRFLSCCVKIFFLIRNGEIQQQTDYKLVLIQEKLPVFSFLNYVFLYKNHGYSDKEKTVILAHETAHIRERHTLDVLLMEGCKILLWFNPLMYLYHEKLKEVHEYLADAAVVESACTTVQYATLMMREAQKHTARVLPVPHFFHNQIKNRLIMLSKHKQPHRGFKIFLSLPVILMLFLTFSTQGELFSQQILTQNEPEAILENTEIPTQNEPEATLEKIETPQQSTQAVEEKSLLQKESEEILWKKVNGEWRLKAELEEEAKAKAQENTDTEAVDLAIDKSLAQNEVETESAMEFGPKNAVPGNCYATDKGTNVWTEIVCPSAMKEELLDQVNNQLKAKGYVTDPLLTLSALGLKLSETTTTALHKYQADNNIHIGMLTTESLKLLGIALEK